MFDNVLIKLVIETIIAQEIIAGIPELPVSQAFQPTQQGVNKAATAYMHKLGDRRIGSPYRADVYDPVQSLEIHTELQQYETDFQFSVLSTQDPSDTTQKTASDIVNLIAYILQSSATIAALEARGVGVLRIQEIRNPYFKDDRDRFESNPSFDITFTHKQIISSSIPILQTTEFIILSV